MLALALVIALVAPIGQKPVPAPTPHEYVVQFCSHADPSVTTRELQRLQAAGLKNVRTLSSPIGVSRHVYRVVSRQFATLAEARLALVEAQRVLSKARIPFHGVVLRAEVAGAPLIR